MMYLRRTAAKLGGGLCLCLLAILAGCAAPGLIPASSTPVPTVAATPTPPAEAPSGMVLVPGGPFYMGLSDEQADALVRYECSLYLERGLRPVFSCAELYGALEPETPQHIVYQDPYYIDQYEVTNDEYRTCIEAGVCSYLLDNYFYVQPRYGDHPVGAVSWFQANTYCRWVGKRLPTEAEWEKAARGTDGRLFPWGNSFEPLQANLCDINCPQLWADYGVNDGYMATAPVGTYQSGVSPYGVYDMVGNVWEWVSDWYSPGYYEISPLENPTGPAHAREYAARGGGFMTAPSEASTTSRTFDLYMSSPRHKHTLGFRCALDAPAGALDPNPLPPPPKSTLRAAEPGDGVVEGWAVLSAQEHYGRLALVDDLEVGFGYLDDWEAFLLRAGWEEDHIRVIRDEVDRDTVSEALLWLAEHADGDDIVLFYYAGMGPYLDVHMRWHAFFPSLWAQVPGQRLLLVDSCAAEYFARAVSGDGGGGLAVGSVRADQCGWFGLGVDGAEVAGPGFTHYLLEGLESPAADLDGDGRVSVQEAAWYAELAHRDYLHANVFPQEDLLRRFAYPWQDNPAEDPAYPSIWMGDWSGRPFFLDLGG